ncbi:nuclear transport factor 2 family protein [Sinomonas albida]|uniref:nuclear transport factor 2 family protein n=1 Tax=Sinomonas albida TaxID=369942 RepID=UPI001457A8AB|nr:nuclear transport factor 2 family protein [Sinomonas albida]
MDEENKDVIRRVYDLLAEGKLAEVMELFAPDAVWSMPGQNALTGEWRGRDAIMNELLPKIAEFSGSTFRATLIDVADGGEHSFALRRSQAERDGQSIDYLLCDVLRIEDGLIRSIQTYPWDARAQDAFWR